MKKKVWIDASTWLEAYSEEQLKAWYQDKKRYKQKENNKKLSEKKCKKK